MRYMITLPTKLVICISMLEISSILSISRIRAGGGTESSTASLVTFRRILLNKSSLLFATC